MEAVRAFNNELSSLYEGRPPVSRAKMAQVTKCAIKAIKFYKHVVQSVEKFIQKCKPEYKVPGLYVIDSIVRQSRHQFGPEKDVFSPRFTKNIVTTFTNLFKCPAEERSRVVRVLNLWQKNSVFPVEVIQPLLDLAADPTNSDLVTAAQKSVDAVVSVTQKVPLPGTQSSSNGGDSSNNQLLQQKDMLSTITKLLQQAQDGSITGAAPESQLQQLQHLQQQLVMQTERISKPQQSTPPIDSNLLAQIQMLTSQLLSKTGGGGGGGGSDGGEDSGVREMKPSQPGFNKKLLDFDYGESDDEDDRPDFHHQSHGQPMPQGGIPAMLQNSNLVQQIQQMSQQQEELQSEIGAQDQLRRRLLEQQQQQFDREIEESAMMAQNVPDMMMQEERVREPDQEEERENADRGDRRRHRSRDRSRSPRRRRRSRSRSRDRRRRSRSRDRHRSRRSRSRERENSRREREKERERRKKGLPMVKENCISVCTTTLWFGHLTKHTTEEELREHIEKYGVIKTINMIPPRGCAFVCLTKRKDAFKALDRLKGVKVNGNSLKVAWAPGIGVKESMFKDLWDVDQGVTYIPWDQLPQDITSLLGGGMVDEDSLPARLKGMKSGEEDENDQPGGEDSLRGNKEPGMPPPNQLQQQQQQPQQMLNIPRPPNFPGMPGQMGLVGPPMGLMGAPPGMDMRLPSPMSGPLGMNAGPPNIGSGPSNMDNSGPSNLNSGPPGMNSGPPGMNNGPPGMNSGPPGMNSGPPGMNSGPPGMNSGPPGMNSGPPGMNSGPQGMNSGPQGMNSGPPGMNSGPPGMNSGLPGMSSGPQGMNSGPSSMNSGPPGMNSGPPGMNSGPPGMNSGPPGLAQALANLASGIPGLQGMQPRSDGDMGPLGAGMMGRGQMPGSPMAGNQMGGPQVSRSPMNQMQRNSLGSLARMDNIIGQLRMNSSNVSRPFPPFPRFPPLQSVGGMRPPFFNNNNNNINNDGPDQMGDSDMRAAETKEWPPDDEVNAEDEEPDEDPMDADERLPPRLPPGMPGLRPLGNPLRPGGPMMQGPGNPMLAALPRAQSPNAGMLSLRMMPPNQQPPVIAMPGGPGAAAAAASFALAQGIARAGMRIPMPNMGVRSGLVPTGAPQRLLSPSAPVSVNGSVVVPAVAVSVPLSTGSRTSPSHSPSPDVPPVSLAPKSESPLGNPSSRPGGPIPLMQVQGTSQSSGTPILGRGFSPMTIRPRGGPGLLGLRPGAQGSGGFNRFGGPRSLLGPGFGGFDRPAFGGRLRGPLRPPLPGFFEEDKDERVLRKLDIDERKGPGDRDERGARKDIDERRLSSGNKPASSAPGLLGEKPEAKETPKPASRASGRPSRWSDAPVSDPAPIVKPPDQTQEETKVPEPPAPQSTVKEPGDGDETVAKETKDSSATSDLPALPAEASSDVSEPSSSIKEAEPVSENTSAPNASNDSTTVEEPDANSNDKGKEEEPNE